MRRAEVIAALLFFLLGAHVVQQSTTLSYFDKFGPGPGFLPFWLGIAWMGLCLLHIGNMALQPHLYPGEQPFPARPAAIRVAAICGFLLVSVFLLDKLGLLVSLLAMAILVLRAIERLSWRSSATAAVVTSGLCYVVFAVILNVPFPRGPWGF